MKTPRDKPHIRKERNRTTSDTVWVVIWPVKKTIVTLPSGLLHTHVREAVKFAVLDTVPFPEFPVEELRAACRGY